MALFSIRFTSAEHIRSKSIGSVSAAQRMFNSVYAKQLKIPTFAEYGDVLRQTDPSLGLSGLLLELMKAE